MGKWFFAIVIAVMVGIIGFTMFPSIKTTIGNNWPSSVTVTNHSFETNDPPLGWSVGGWGVPSLTRSNTQKHDGLYSGKIISDTGTCGAYQIIPSFASYANKEVKMSAWVFASVGGVGQLVINDGVTTSGGNIHSGSSSWEYLTVRHNVDGTPLDLRLVCYVYNAANTVYVDDVTFVSGESIPEVEPSLLLQSFTSGLPYALVFFIGYAIYLGYKKTKGG
jgi:hypothetical protein